MVLLTVIFATCKMKHKVKIGDKIIFTSDGEYGSRKCQLKLQVCFKKLGISIILCHLNKAIFPIYNLKVKDYKSLLNFNLEIFIFRMDKKF